MSLMESLNDNRTKVQIVPSPTTKKGKRKRGKGRRCNEGPDWVLVRERERLLSRFTGDPTVEILQAKKESCYTRRGLHVDSSFREFRQTPRGREFILLRFYTLFKCFMMFRLV